MLKLILSAYKRYPLLLALIWMSIGFQRSAVSQSLDAPSPQSAASVLDLAWNAFSGRKAIHAVRLTGEAHRYQGSMEDSGFATLWATSSGEARMNLSFNNRGSWNEDQSDIGSKMECNWSEGDGAAHPGESQNCLKPIVWFLPSLAMQSVTIPVNVGYTDLGNTNTCSGTYRHVQAQAASLDLPHVSVSQSAASSSVDVGLDPSTFLPFVSCFHIRPDTGGPPTISVEIAYGNYKAVDGVEVPFLIRRFVNGALQLELTIQSVTIH